MITLFNRKELILTMEMKRQAEIRDILSANGIKYVLKTTNQQRAAFMGSTRTRTGSFCINPDYIYVYKFYVHKNDYDMALYLLNNK